MRWTPRFDYAAVQLELELPQGLWQHRVPVAAGGDIESTAGFPASYIVRRAHILAVPLRFYESEWPDVRALLEYGQTGLPFTWFPDQLELESFEVYLEGPEVGKAIEPRPDARYPRALSLTIELRRTDDAPWDLEYFSE